MLHKKPGPLLRSGESRRLCPVCGTASYSRYGIHPQCAQQQADAPRVARLRAVRQEREQADASTRSPAALAWQKRCPACGTQLPNRKMSCGCGHTFAPAPPSRTMPDDSSAPGESS